MLINNNLKLTTSSTRVNTNKHFLINGVTVEKRKSKKGINLFYNTKLNAISGLCTTYIFTKTPLKIFLEKKRENAIKYLFDAQALAFYNFLMLNKKINVFLKNNSNYKVMRLASGLPIRGQRTHTNSKTARRLNKIYS